MILSLLLRRKNILSPIIALIVLDLSPVSDTQIKNNKDKKEALAYLPKLNSLLMKIAKTGIIKKQNAARNVSRITRKINSLNNLK